MSIPTITITGQAIPPDDEAIGGTIRAILSGFDVDSATDIVAPREVSAPISNTGDFTIDLWPNSRGSKGTHYAVYLELPRPSPGAGLVATKLGQISLNEALPTRPLASILTATTGPTPIIILPGAWADFLKAAAAFYSSVAAGMAVTANDGYFFVSTEGGLSIELWRRVANVATPVRLQITVAS